MCGRLFNVLNNERICPACQKKLEDKFHEVKQYLEDHPGASVEQTATDNDISTKQIRQWVKEERCLLAHPDFLPYVLSVYDRHLCSLERFYHKNINLARGIGDLSPIFTLSAFRSWSRNFHC